MRQFVILKEEDEGGPVKKHAVSGTEGVHDWNPAKVSHQRRNNL